MQLTIQLNRRRQKKPQLKYNPFEKFRVPLNLCIDYRDNLLFILCQNGVFG